MTKQRPHSSALLARESTLERYAAALETEDAKQLSEVIDVAAQDPELEQMIRVYNRQHRDASGVLWGETAALRGH